MNRKTFYRRPSVQTVAGALALAAVYWWTARADPPASATTIIFDLGLGAAALLAGLALTSQFVIPVQSAQNRWNSFLRMIEYVTGSRGPVMFVRDGQAIEAHGERRRRGPGVLLIDHASAAVLRTPTRFTRPVGPGVVFTRPGESLAQALDLRIQVRTLSGQPPLPSDESQASNPTLALTEDGIPVSAHISVTFMLDPGHDVAPRSGQFPHAPPFEFNPRAAERAVYGEAHRRGQPTPWAELPLLMAVDRFREEIETWQLEDLLRTRPNEAPAMRKISQAMALQLVRGGGQSDRSESGSESTEILTQRGIRVLGVQVSDLQVPQEIRLEHMLRWREEWLTGLEEALQDARTRAQELRAQGASEGQRLLLQGITHSLRAKLDAGHEPEPVETLTTIVDDALELLQDPTLEPAASEVSKSLRRLRHELENLDRASPQGLD